MQFKFIHLYVKRFFLPFYVTGNQTGIKFGAIQKPQKLCVKSNVLNLGLDRIVN